VPPPQIFFDSRVENGAFWCIIGAIFDVNLVLMIKLVYIKISLPFKIYSTFLGETSPSPPRRRSVPVWGKVPAGSMGQQSPPEAESFLALDICGKFAVLCCRMMFAQISESIIEHFVFCELHIFVLFALWNMGKSADTEVAAHS